MPDFTEAEIRDAIKNPRPGDVWQTDGCAQWRVDETYPGGVVLHGRSVYGPHFREWTSNATLLRRGA